MAKALRIIKGYTAERYIEMLRFYASGYTIQKVSEEFYLSKRTVESAFNDMRKMYGAKHLTHLVHILHQKGLL